MVELTVDPISGFRLYLPIKNVPIGEQITLRDTGGNKIGVLINQDGGCVSFGFVSQDNPQDGMD